MSRTPSVLIVKSELESFRVPFYCQLGDTLSGRGIKLRVAVPKSRFDGLSCPAVSKWFLPVHTVVLRIGSRRVPIQWVLPPMARSDLVIVQQNLLELANYPAFACRRLLGFRLAFWGHGKNFRVSELSLTERLRRYLSTVVDYWFAYNDKSAQVVRDLGYPPERICSVNNSIDTRAESKFYDGIASDDAHRTRVELGIGPDDKVGIYCGRFYREKRLDFLIEAARQLRQRITRFHLILIGDGPQTATISAFATSNPEWVHYVGAKYNGEKARYFRVSDLFLLPGAVGLSIVDSFAYKTPLVTTEGQSHGPEIAYMEHGRNGLVTKNTIEDYVGTVVNVLGSAGSEGLVDGCEKSRELVTLEKMVESFASGVMAAIELART